MVVGACEQEGYSPQLNKKPTGGSEKSTIEWAQFTLVCVSPVLSPLKLVIKPNHHSAHIEEVHWPNDTHVFLLQPHENSAIYSPEVSAHGNPTTLVPWPYTASLQSCGKYNRKFLLFTSHWCFVIAAPAMKMGHLKNCLARVQETAQVTEDTGLTSNKLFPAFSWLWLCCLVSLNPGCPLYSRLNGNEWMKENQWQATDTPEIVISFFL